MKYVVDLSEVEELTLQQLSINHRHQDIRTRAAGVPMLGQRIKVPATAERLGVSVPAVYSWRMCGALRVSPVCWVATRVDGRGL